MEKPKPEIRIRKDWCKGCCICVEFCPKSVLEMGRSYPEVIDISACTECGLCEVMCPDFAIQLSRTRGKRSEQRAK